MEKTETRRFNFENEITVTVEVINSDTVRVDWQGTLSGRPVRRGPDGLMEFLIEETKHEGRIIPNLDLHFENLKILPSKIGFLFDVLEELQNHRKQVTLYYGLSNRQVQMFLAIQESLERRADMLRFQQIAA